MTPARAPIDELRALPPALHRVVLARIEEEHGAEAVAALRWCVDAHRRPAQRIPELDELPTITVITGEYGSGKTQLATWITARAILEWRVERPRIVAATPAKLADTLVFGGSGLLAWLPPWIEREWQASTGHAGTLRLSGIEVSCLSAAAGAQAIGSEAGLVLFDDFAQTVLALGRETAEAALVACFKSLRGWPGKMLLPTTPDGAELVAQIASDEGMGAGVGVIDLGRAEENAGNLSSGYLRTIVPGLRSLGLFLRDGGGAFADVDWPRWRVERVPDLARIGVWIDPAKTGHACDAGVVGLGIASSGLVYGIADRSRPMSSAEWPTVAWDLHDELHERFPGASIYFGIEVNTGRDGIEHLRAAEKLRRVARGLPPVSAAEIRDVTARPREDKVERARPVVELAKGGGLRMARGLGPLEGQLARLGASGQNGAADAFVHGVRDLAGLAEKKPAHDPSAARRAAEAAAIGMRTLNSRAPAPAIPGGMV